MEESKGDEIRDDLTPGFRLDGVEVLPRADLIRIGGESVHLEPRVMHVLVTLARHRGRTVTRDELMDAVWGDTVVGDEVLSRAISLLRSALGDERTSPRFIRTVPRRGYQLVADVAPLAASAPPERTGRRPPWWALAAGAAVVAAVVTALLLRVDPDPEPVTLAVIPFDTQQVDEPHRHAGEAIADQLIRRLTGVEALTVIARRSSFQFRDAALDIRDIGERLDARYVVEGAVEQRRERLLVTLYLVDSARGANVWTKTVEGNTADLYRLGDLAYRALGSAVARHVGTNLRISEHAASRNPEDPAYRLLLEARYQWSLRGDVRLLRAVELLENAINLQPDFAIAHLALAEAVAALPFYTDQGVPAAFARARSELSVAVQQDPSLAPEADALRGMMLMREQRWQESRELLEQSLRRNPNSVHGNYWYSMLLSSLGDYDQALQHIERAHRLDPLSAVINDRLALAYVWVGRLEAAAARYRESAKLGFLESTQPKPLALFYYRTGRYQDIRRLFRRIGPAGSWLDAFVDALEDPRQRPASTAVIDAEISAGNVPRELWFGIWLLLRDADRAFRDFDDGPKTQDIEVLWSDEAALLRHDPRFPELLRRVGLLDDGRLPPGSPAQG